MIINIIEGTMITAIIVLFIAVTAGFAYGFIELGEWAFNNGYINEFIGSSAILAAVSCIAAYRGGK